jgi:hypothetical protein
MIEREMDNVCAVAQSDEFAHGREQGSDNREHSHKQREKEERAVGAHPAWCADKMMVR